MSIKRVAAIHDMSGYGRCSLTVAIPIISVMGIQVCPLPTAYLSTHTGGFTGYTFLDLTDEIKPISDHWASLNINFDAVYSGFLGSQEQIFLVRDFIERFRTDSSIAVVDPVMADNGKPYPTYTPEMCRDMVILADSADLLTPNFTEASILLGEDYENVPTEISGIENWVKRLSKDGKRSVIITGVSSCSTDIGAACYDSKTGKTSFVMTDLIEGEYHGTGDVFASVVTGSLLRGENLKKATRSAVDFVRDCAELACETGGQRRDGVDFEKLLKQLI